MAEKIYHAILLDTEFQDSSFIGRWKELGRKHSRTNNWWQIKVEVQESKLEELIKDGQKLLANSKFYFQVYCQGELAVVFPEKIFNLNPDRSDWAEMLDYARKLGIPDDQLDMKPVKFEEETY